jgi:hypothetical protein
LFRNGTFSSATWGAGLSVIPVRRALICCWPGPCLMKSEFVYIVMCRVVRATKMTGSSSDEWIY